MSMDGHEEIKSCVETMLYYHGKFQYINKHMARLKKTVYQITNKRIDTREIQNHIENHIDTLPYGNIVIKLVYDLKKHKYTLTSRNYQYVPINLKVGISEHIRQTHPENWIKSTNRKLYKTVEAEALQKGFDDMIILNEFGRVCESTIANVFIYKDGIYYTPELSEGCIEGVFRTVFIQKAKIKKFTVIEKPLTIDDVKSADKVYLTNAVRKMYPVQVVF